MIWTALRAQAAAAVASYAVEVIDGDGFAEDEDGLGAGDPVEVFIPKEAVVTSEGGKVVTDGITMTLG